MADLASNILGFGKLLDREYGFKIGHADVQTALSAINATDIRHKRRFRSALRIVFCSKPQDIAPFDRAFDRFFGNESQGVRQPRPPRIKAGDEQHHTQAAGKREIQDEQSPAQSWLAMRARYSPVAGTTDAAPAISERGLAEALANASRLVNALHLGRSRRWKPNIRGSRLDIRRTLRSSLKSGGDPLYLRMFGHPRRNPRIVLVIDASRSMAEHAATMLQFGYALCRRSTRARVFVFSTALTEVTRALRRLPQERERAITLGGETWGGGTRLGSALRNFAKAYAAHVDPDTLVIIASDGLDAAGADDLREALRRLHRASAGIIWLNPHAGAPGFAPAARAMQAAMPYVTALLDTNDLRALAVAARALRR